MSLEDVARSSGSSDVADFLRIAHNDDGSLKPSALGGSIAPSTITLTNPATTGLTIVPASGQTSDVLVINAGSQAVAAGTSLDLIHLTSHNTGPATSVLYSLRIDTQADTVDTGAGIAIVNSGNADCIYLNAQGAAGTATTPTGIGLDMNKATATTENSSTYAGFGLQIWDFSTTNIGGATVGPTGIFLLKKNNPDTDHVSLYIRANRNAIQLTIPNAASGGYVATKPIFNVTDNSGVSLYLIQADGQVQMKNANSLFFNMAAGAQGYIQGNASNQLDVRGGTGGVRVLDSTGASVRLAMTDAGAFTFNASLVIAADGQQTLANAKALFFTKASAGSNGSIQMNASDQLDIHGGSAVSGIRFLNNAGTQVNLTIQDAGSLVLFDGGNIGLGSTTGTKIGTASTQKLGFYGATAIVRPSAVGAATGYAAGTTAVTFHSDDTYTGNVGATAYTLNGIVAALKNLGLIAS
jgi:hypothetical protein